MIGSAVTAPHYKCDTCSEKGGATIYDACYGHRAAVCLGQGHVRYTHTCSRFSHDSEDDPVFRALEGDVRGLIKKTRLENVY